NLVLPAIHHWLQSPLSFDLVHDGRLLLFLLGLAVFVTIAAGAYPALVLSSWKPVTALKRQISDNSSAFFRKGLIILQYVVVQSLIVCTIIISLQVRHMKDADTGFNKESVLMVPIPDPDKGK